MTRDNNLHYASGKVEKRNYTKGELHGPATISWSTGDVFEFSYRAGTMEGEDKYFSTKLIFSLFTVHAGNAVFHSHTGLSEERSYVDGVCHGPATLRTPQVSHVTRDTDT